MTTTQELSATRDVTASCQQIWDMLADGWTYSQWVVGNSRTRAVDSHWPQPGSAIRHSIGVWPLVIDDQTTVAALLESLGFPDRGIAVALDQAVLPRSDWTARLAGLAGLNAPLRLEVVTAVQGG